jgi:hypothetical protein
VREREKERPDRLFSTNKTFLFNTKKDPDIWTPAIYLEQKSVLVEIYLESKSAVTSVVYPVTYSITGYRPYLDTDHVNYLVSVSFSTINNKRKHV